MPAAHLWYGADINIPKRASSVALLLTLMKFSQDFRPSKPKRVNTPLPICLPSQPFGALKTMQIYDFFCKLMHAKPVNLFVDGIFHGLTDCGQ
jgi:hypothetical protein